MPSHRRPRSSTIFFGVRARIYDIFGAQINTGGMRVWLGTYRTADEAARAYAAASRRFNRCVLVM
jgi:hypothetical protein